MADDVEVEPVEEGWIVPKRISTLEQFDRAADKNVMFHCVRFKCTMKAYHCIHRQMVRDMVEMRRLPRWTTTNTICAAGQCRQGNEMARQGWAQLIILEIRKKP